MTLKRDAKFEEKPICSLKNDKNLVNFDPSTHKPQKFALVPCKVYNLWPKKIQRSYLSWHWRVMQNLKKKWLVVWKMSWGIWQIFNWDFDRILLTKVENVWAKKELCVMKLKNDEKSEKDWLVVSKLTWGIWRTLTRALKSLKICTLMAAFDQSI